MRTFLLIISQLSLVALAVFGLIVFLSTQPPEMAAEVMPIVPTAAHAARFDKEITTFQEKTHHPQPDEAITISVTQEEATSKLDSIIRRADSPVRFDNVVLNFSKGKILGMATVKMNVEVNIGVVARVEIDAQGKPRLVIEQVDIGRGAHLPAGLADQVAGFLPSIDQVTDYLQKLPVKLTSVVIADGRITITGKFTGPPLQSISVTQDGGQQPANNISGAPTT